jgi:hypothetical protein
VLKSFITVKKPEISGNQTHEVIWFQNQSKIPVPKN